VCSSTKLGNLKSFPFLLRKAGIEQKSMLASSTANYLSVDIYIIIIRLTTCSAKLPVRKELLESFGTVLSMFISYQKGKNSKNEVEVKAENMLCKNTNVLYVFLQFQSFQFRQAGIRSGKV